MKPHIKRHLLRMTVGFTSYALAVFAGGYFYKAGYPHKTWLVLLPVFPLIYIAATIIRSISEKDEMWRKIITEAFAFSAIATGFTCIMAAYAGIGLFFSFRRYK